ncbi:hypothetical protein I6N95_14745 [Vagococcus sp. BWB3-3]|uniref:LXG domain-containing protein n=1 Tax=Vagococcus allomyrinae TaxID=2794353 RepID=A0A940P729_9ENTE|nr:T7SS effector LXG polymorphic toxin [Vagococcus allomyrinae]MBP1042275.1 hypothetical protein [Vagococcus allomyrinae]
MSVDMYLSASQNQSSSVSQMTKQQVQSYEQLQKAITDFSLNSPFLTGAAYESAKTYFDQVLYPLVQGGVLLSEAVEQAVKKLPEAYLADVDNGDLKQSELEEKLQQVDRLISQAEEIGGLLHSSSTPEMTKEGQLSANTRMIGLYRTVKQELEEKLYKLMAFNQSSATIFTEIAALEEAVIQGLAQTKTAFSSNTGVFNVPCKADLAWQTVIVTKLQERGQEKDEHLIKTVINDKASFEEELAD